MTRHLPDTCPKCHEDSLTTQVEADSYQDHWVMNLRMECVACGWGARYEAEVNPDWRKIGGDSTTKNVTFIIRGWGKPSSWVNDDESEAP